MHSGSAGNVQREPHIPASGHAHALYATRQDPDRKKNPPRGNTPGDSGISPIASPGPTTPAECLAFHKNTRKRMPENPPGYSPPPCCGSPPPRLLHLLTLLLLLTGFCASAASAVAGPITDVPGIHPTDRRRFTLNGAPWYPVGYYPSVGALTSDQSDFVNYYKVLIDRQAANGVNYFRAAFTMGQPYGNATLPYLRTGPGLAVDGKPKFDLSRFNEAHFDYWRNVVSYAQQKGVVIQLCIFDFWHAQKWITEGNWGLKWDFYQGANNINGVNVTTPAEWLNRSHPVFPYQRALAEKVVQRLGDLPNIVWEIANEASVTQGSYGTNWQLYMADYITNYERSRGLKPHLVMPRDIPSHEHTPGYLLDSPWTIHSQMVQMWNQNKPLMSDNDSIDNPMTPTYRRQKIWACLTAGAHSDFFHLPAYQMSVLTGGDVAEGMRYVGLVGKFITALNVDLVGMTPADNLVSNGWCYARNGNEYVVYLISGGTTTVYGLPASYQARWFNPRDGSVIAAGTGPTFRAPDGNDWALHIKAGSTLPAPTAQAPYGGTPRALPGMIQIEDFDEGGQGVSYLDSDNVNTPGQYRNTAVDVNVTQDAGGGYDIGWTFAGEWLEYTVDVKSAGTYALDFRVASQGLGGRFHVEVDGKDVTGPLTVPDTTGWQTWQTLRKSGVVLPSGSHVVRVAFDANGATGGIGNFNWFQFTAEQSAPNTPPTVSLTAPSAALTVTEGAAVSLAANAADADGNVAKVEFYAGQALLGTATASPYTYSWTPTAGTYTVTAKATDNTGASTTSSGVPVTVNAPSTGGLAVKDLGTVAKPGSVVFDQATNVYSLRSSGGDIWGTADAFTFGSVAVSGDVEVVARVSGLTATAPWAKAAVMIRETLTAGSRHAMAAVSSASGVAFQRRTATDNVTTHTGVDGVKAPVWLKVRRQGTTLTAWRSTDGNAWTLIGQDTVAMAANAYAGLALSPHTAGDTATATFDNYAIKAVVPTLALSAPAAGQTGAVNQAVTLEAQENDGGTALSSVDFYVGDTKVGTASTRPFRVTWTPTATGPVSLSARATTSGGTAVQSPAVSFTVNATAPSTGTIGKLPITGADYGVALDRTMTGDETWTLASRKVQYLNNGGANRVITLDAIAPDRIPVGTSYAIRGFTWGFSKVTVKDSAGNVVGEWGGALSGQDQVTRWVTLSATSTGWKFNAAEGRPYENWNSAFSYFGGNMVPLGTGWPDGMYTKPRSLRADGYRIRFKTDSDKFIISNKASLTRFRVFVNGEEVAYLQNSVNDGTQLCFLIDLKTPGTRNIEILADQFNFWGVILPDSKYTLSAWTENAPAPRVTFIGDSISEGYTTSLNWVAGLKLGLDVWNHPWGATGYIANANNTRSTYVQRVDEDVVSVKPDVVVISGGINDMFYDPAQFRAAVVNLFDTVQAKVPNAKKIVIGPYWPQTPLHPQIVEKRDIVKDVAAQKGWAFIDWLGWITGKWNEPQNGGNAYLYTSSDGTHPTDAGRKYLGERLATELQKILGTTTPTTPTTPTEPTTPTTPTEPTTPTTPTEPTTPTTPTTGATETDPANPMYAYTVNARNYGAKGDGIADDTRAIRSAMAAVATKGGGSVFIPAGTYKIMPQTLGEAGGIVIEQNNIRIYGEGPDKTVLSFRVRGDRDPNTAWDVINGMVTRGSGIAIGGTGDINNPRKNIVIHDLKLLGNAPATGQTFYPASTTNGDGWDLTHKGITLGADRAINNVRIQNVHVGNFRGEVIYSGGYMNGLLEIFNCKIWGTNADGISVSNNLVARGNEIWDCAHAGVESYHMNRVLGVPQNGIYENNFIEPRRTLKVNGKIGINVFNDGTNAYDPSFRSTPVNVVVRGNTVKNAWHYGFMSNLCLFDSVIENNTFLDCGISGEPFYGAVNLTAGGGYNQVMAIDGVAVRGNRIEVTGARPAGYAFELTSGGHKLKNITIENNTVVGPTSGNMLRRFLILLGAPGEVVQNVVMRNNTANVVQGGAAEDLGKNNYRATRPLYQGNSVNAQQVIFLDDDFYVPAGSPEVAPVWSQARITAGSEGAAVSIGGIASRFAEGATVRFYTQDAKSFTIQPNSAWNSLTSAVSGRNGSPVVLKKVNGKFTTGTETTTPTQPAVTVALASPASGTTFAPNTAVTLSATASVVGTTVQKVEFFAGFTLVGTATASPYSATWTPTATGTYSLTAKATTASGLTSTSAAATVTIAVPAPSEPLPSTLTAADLGTVTTAGSDSYNAASGTFTIRAAGSDIWGTADSFRFISQPSSGDLEIIARVASLTNTDPWAKAGLMIRESSAANARHATIVVTPANGVSFQWRAETGGTMQDSNTPGVAAPRWVRLVRRGNTVTGYQSADGVSWQQVGTATIALPDTALIGLAVTSHNAAALTTAVIDNVTVVDNQETFTSQDVGTVKLAGSATYDDASGTFTLTGSGADIWGTADAFQFVHETLSGDVELVARVASLTNTDPWAKTGLMIRENLTAGSAHAMVAVTSGNGVSLQSRAATGGSSTDINSAGVSAPRWIKLVRRTSQISAYHSVDGKAWTHVGTVTLVLPDTVHVGLVVTSHNPDALATAKLDNVSLTKVDLPKGQDVGTVGLAGSTQYAPATDQYTVTGAGADIWGTADAFHYANTGVEGDTTITAKVETVAPVNPWTKAGVMIREGTGASDRHVLLAVTPQNGIALQWRPTAGAPMQNLNRAGLVAPYWVQLKRAGDTFTASISKDGATWEVLGTATVAMPAQARAGLAVTSHDTARTATATFSGVQVQP